MEFPGPIRCLCPARKFHLHLNALTPINALSWDPSINFTIVILGQILMSITDILYPSFISFISAFAGRFAKGQELKIVISQHLHFHSTQKQREDTRKQQQWVYSTIMIWWWWSRNLMCFEVENEFILSTRQILNYLESFYAIIKVENLDDFLGKFYMQYTAYPQKLCKIDCFIVRICLNIIVTLKKVSTGIYFWYILIDISPVGQAGWNL